MHYKFHLLFSAFILLTFYGCTPATKQAEVENADQLREEIVHAVGKIMAKGDTVFLASTRMLGVCGNDDRFDGAESIQDKTANMKNTYYLDAERFKDNYKFQGKKFSLERLSIPNFLPHHSISTTTL